MRRNANYFFVLLMLITAIEGMGTTMFAVGLKDLTLTAGKIVQTKVTGIVTQWTSDSTQIVSYIRMNIVDDMISNEEDNEIIVKQPGGKMGAQTMMVEGTTTYKVGDENIVFLRPDYVNNAAYQTIGLYQGKYRIFTDASGIRRVAQDVNGKVILMKSQADGAGVVETGNNLPLGEFKSKVLQYRSIR
jgi:hypothetical protein